MRFVFDFSTLFGVKTKSQKLHICTSNVSDLRFLLVEFQEKFFSMKGLIFASVLSAAFLLLQKIIISSA